MSGSDGVLYNDLLYSVSHDLRAPFRQIKEFSKLMSSRLASQYNSEDVDIHRYMDLAIRQANDMLDALLTLSRIRHHPLRSEASVVSLSPIVHRLLDVYVSTGQIHNSAIDVADLPRVTGYPEYIDLLFKHLLDNSIRHGGNVDGLTVSIMCETTHDALHITITNNGPEFSRSVLDKPFVLFSQKHQYHVTQHLGVGLAFCQAIMAIHNGNIQLNNSPDHHPVLTLSFPL